MKNRLVPLLVLCAAAAAIYLALAHRPARPQNPAPLNASARPVSEPGKALVAPPGLAEQPSESVATNHPAQPAPALPGESLASTTGSAPAAGADPEVSAPAALEHMRQIIRQYRSMFGGNPVGVNSEITKALQGDNPKQINFLQGEGNRVNNKGELIDPWGTPYFFHQLSGTEMEIRSAGPDRVLWTDDDLVVK